MTRTRLKDRLLPSYTRGEELTNMMGGTQSKLQIASKPPTVIMMVGLQGAGKTTHAGKLAGMYKKQGKRPLLVACDVYRPAAIKQLEVLGAQLDIPVFQMGDKENPVKIAKEGIKLAEQKGYDMVFIDTAGRLQIDEELMAELVNIKEQVKPTEILLTVDAMIGQESVNVAETFNNMLDITGVILTKLDGDTRGGAALSIRYVTGKPIKFIGVGEKLDAIEPFHPDRMASRILGMGDIVGLVEKAAEKIDQESAMNSMTRMMSGEFNFNDFLSQMKMMQSLGPLEGLLGLLPGFSKIKKQLPEGAMDPKRMKRMEAIVLSMTPAERVNYKLLIPSRRRRIAKGSGVSEIEVNRFIKNFKEMKNIGFTEIRLVKLHVVVSSYSEIFNIFNVVVNSLNYVVASRAKSYKLLIFFFSFGECTN